nr:transposase domain-containing protein [Bacteroides uniformis]
MVSTCKEHAVDPRKWMEDVLVRIPQYENQKLDLRKLLPHNWQKEANL